MSIDRRLSASMMTFFCAAFPPPRKSSFFHMNIALKLARSSAGFVSSAGNLRVE